MARYVDIDKHVYVRYIDERSGEVVTSEHTIAEILENTVGLFQVEDDVKKVVLCKNCKHFWHYKEMPKSIPVPGCFREGIKRWREVNENGYCDKGEGRE